MEEMLVFGKGGVIGKILTNIEYCFID